jgi:hypothetical protein
MGTAVFVFTGLAKDDGSRLPPPQKARGLRFKPETICITQAA